MKRTAVLNVVGLSDSVIGDHTPKISQFVSKGRKVLIHPAFPAVTCTAQSSYVTGKMPAEHGIVGNGWYDRTLAEVQFWKQSNHLVSQPKIWDELHGIDPKFTCAKLFWWYNMYASVDYSITPRPMYPADGRKVFDIYTGPFSMREEIKKDLGEFPFPSFWGPRSGIESSQWIAHSAKWIEEKHQPTLSLVYLPHLDYNLQKLGPAHPAISEDYRKIDDLVGDLISYFERRDIQVVLLSEYGIGEVNHPIHLNRIFRNQGWVTIKNELDLELLDCGASRVFAVADHQVAHVYLNDPTLESKVRQVLEKEAGIDQILGREQKEKAGILHPRAGDLIAVANAQSWFTYYYWLDDSVAPDFARCVDIHRKPGYDPVELFVDPQIQFPLLKVGWKLLKKKLGFRILMDVIPLDASLVKGSHGRIPESTTEFPVLISKSSQLIPQGPIQPTDVYQVIKNHLTG